MEIARIHPENFDSSETIPTTWEDLTQVVLKYQREQHDIIIGLDANWNCDGTDNYMTTFKTETNLTDCFLLFHHQHKISSTIHGTNRIDTILMSKDIMNDVSNIYFLPIYSLIPSDHHDIILELNRTLLFHPRHPNTTAIQEQCLVLTRPKVVTKYTSSLWQSFTKNNIQDRIEKSQARLKCNNNKENVTIFNNIAIQVSQLQRNAEKNVIPSKSHTPGPLNFGKKGLKFECGKLFSD